MIYLIVFSLALIIIGISRPIYYWYAVGLFFFFPNLVGNFLGSDFFSSVIGLSALSLIVYRLLKSYDHDLNFIFTFISLLCFYFFGLFKGYAPEISILNNILESNNNMHDIITQSINNYGLVKENNSHDSCDEIQLVEIIKESIKNYE